MDNHNVRKGETIMFADEVERTVYPLTLKSLRKFVGIIDKMNSTDAMSMSEEDIELMADASRIILDRIDPSLANDRERLEDAVDLSIFSRIMQVAMGNSSPEA